MKIVGTPGCFAFAAPGTWIFRGKIKADLKAEAIKRK